MQRCIAALWILLGARYSSKHCPCGLQGRAWSDERHAKGGQRCLKNLGIFQVGKDASCAVQAEEMEIATAAASATQASAAMAMERCRCSHEHKVPHRLIQLQDCSPEGVT